MFGGSDVITRFREMNFLAVLARDTCSHGAVAILGVRIYISSPGRAEKGRGDDRTRLFAPQWLTGMAIIVDSRRPTIMLESC